MRRLIVRGPGLRGPKGRDGLPGVNAVPADEAVAGYISTPASATQEALAATLVTQIGTEGNALRDAILALIGEYEPPGPAVPTIAESGPGWSIKAGSLDRYRASKADPTALTEVVVFGDSTTQGSGDETGGGYVPELRRLALTSGAGDGGQGIARYSMTAAESGDNLAPVFASTATSVTNGNQFDLYNANTPKFSTVGQSITYQGRGTRLRVYYGRQAGYARFSYAVDGGSAVVVDPLVGLGNANSRIGVIDLDTLSNTLHKVVITNLGRATSPASIFAVNGSGGGAIPALTVVRYVVTAVTAAGESLPSAEVAAQRGDPSSYEVAINKSALSAVTSFKVYRSDNGPTGGPYGLIGTVPNTSGDNFVRFNDNNAVAPGVAPPTTDTSGVASAVNGPVAVDTEWTRATGIVFHNQGVSGSDYGSYFGGSPFTAAEAALGLVQTDSTNPADPQTQAATPPWRKPSLATCALGINNQNGSTSGTDAIAYGASVFARICINAGIDGVLVVPHFEHSVNDAQRAAHRTAIINVADEYGLSWVALDEALDDGDYSGPPQHLDHEGYVLEAQRLWTTILSK